MDTTTTTPSEPMPHLTSVPMNCTVCEKPDGRLCTQCKAAAYCSKECQKNDWPSHKMLCKCFTKFQLETPRPSNAHILALAFKPDTKVPEFVWVKKYYDRTFGFDDCSTDVGAIVFPNTTRIATPLRFHFNPRSGGTLRDHKVDVHYNDMFVFDGSMVNNAIKAVTLPHGKLSWDWRGAVVAVGAGRHYTAHDIDLKHFRDLIDNFIYYNSGMAMHPNVQELTEEDFYDYDDSEESENEDDEATEPENGDAPEPEGGED